MKFYRLASGFPTRSGSLLPTKRGRELPTLTIVTKETQEGCLSLKIISFSGLSVQKNLQQHVEKAFRHAAASFSVSEKLMIENERHPSWVSCTHFSFPPAKVLLRIVPLVSSVTGGPVPAYISAGSSKAVTVPAPADTACSPWRRLSAAFPGQRPFPSLF